ncbi:MAG: putative immunity protein [Betaproteobacteria bacterium]
MRWRGVRSGSGRLSRAAAFAAHAAARGANHAGACDAARATGHAVATAHVGTHALHASTCAVRAAAYAVNPSNASTRAAQGKSRAITSLALDWRACWRCSAWSTGLQWLRMTRMSRV